VVEVLVHFTKQAVTMPPHQTPSADESSEHKHFNHGADRNVNGHDYASFMETGDNGLVPGLSPKRRATVSQVYDPSFFKIANPGPLGLFSFALTTFVLGFYQCGVGYVLVSTTATTLNE
jgi:hypothetical protein